MNPKKLKIFGREHLIKFFNKLNELTSKKIKFDLIVGPGDSGAGMAKCAEMFFIEKMNKSPPIIKIPFYRSWHKPNMTHVTKTVKAQLTKIKLKNILFVDDEIGSGETLKGVSKILLNLKNTSTKPNIYVVAETKGLKKFYKIDGAKIKFLPFAKRIKKGVYNVVSKSIPFEIERQILRKYSDSELGSTQRFNILLGEPIKNIQRGKPFYTYEWNRKLKKEIIGFDTLQKNFKKYILSLIKKSS